MQQSCHIASDGIVDLRKKSEDKPNNITTSNTTTSSKVPMAKNNGKSKDESSMIDEGWDNDKDFDHDA